jgi:hypothetical protein
MGLGERQMLRCCAGRAFEAVELGSGASIRRVKMAWHQCASVLTGDRRCLLSAAVQSRTNAMRWKRSEEEEREWEDECRRFR